MQVTAKPNASKRVKERAKQHDLVRRTSTLTPQPHAMVLFGCKTCMWVGWLPPNELQESE